MLAPFCWQSRGCASSSIQYINPHLLLQGNIEAEQAEQRKREKEERKRVEEEQRQREVDEAEAQRRADEEAAAAKAKVCSVRQGYQVRVIMRQQSRRRLTRMLLLWWPTFVLELWVLSAVLVVLLYDSRQDRCL